MKTSKRRLGELDARLSALEAQREAVEKFPHVMMLCGVDPASGEIASFSALVIDGDPIKPEPGETLETFATRCEEIAKSLPRPTT